MLLQDDVGGGLGLRSFVALAWCALFYFSYSYDAFESADFSDD